MSDAFSDIARDERRSGFFDEYIFRVKSYVLNPTADSFKAAVKAAREVDSVGRGYWGSSTNLTENIENHLRGLISEDKEVKEKEWAKFLRLVINNYQFKELKALSPFADKTVVLVDYGVGFVNIEGLEFFESLISKAIRNQDMKTYDCDDYLVVMPPIEINPDEIKAIWLRCGIPGINGTRKPDER